MSDDKEWGGGGGFSHFILLWHVTIYITKKYTELIHQLLFSDYLRLFTTYCMDNDWTSFNSKSTSVVTSLKLKVPSKFFRFCRFNTSGYQCWSSAHICWKGMASKGNHCGRISSVSLSWPLYVSALKMWTSHGGFSGSSIQMKVMRPTSFASRACMQASSSSSLNAAARTVGSDSSTLPPNPFQNPFPNPVFFSPSSTRSFSSSTTSNNVKTFFFFFMSTLTKPSRLVKLFMRATTSAPSLLSNNLNQKSDDDDGGEDAEKVLIWRRRKNLLQWWWWWWI